MPDWEPIDPQLQQWVAEGVSPMEMCRRLGWDRKKRQTIVDRLRKIGLKEPAQSKPKPEEPMSDETPVEVLPGQICRYAWGKKAPAITVSQLRTLLEVVLPLKTLTIEDVLQLVAGRQQRNHRAFLSHRKRRIHAKPS
jgi:hypothetical protein